MVEWKPDMKNVKDVVSMVASAAHNAEVTGAKITPEYVAWWAEVSVRFATYMIQYWEGAGRPVEDPRGEVIDSAYEELQRFDGVQK